MEKVKQLKLIDYKWLSVFIALNVLDCILTAFALKAGVEEMNPILSNFSFPGLVSVKMGIVAVTGILICYLNKENIKDLALSIIGVVVFHNILTLVVAHIGG